MAKKKISGHLEEKRGLFYIVLYLPDEVTKKKAPKWFATGLSVKGNLTKANEILRKAKNDASNGILPERRTVGKTQKCTEPLALPKTFTRDMLYSEYIKLWLHLKRTSIEATTYESYYGLIHKDIAPYFERQGVRLCDLTTLDIQGYYTYLSATRHIKGNSILKHHANIRKSLEDAVKPPWSLIKSNPAAAVERPRIDNFSSGYYGQDEINQLFKVFAGDPIELPVVLASVYGFRRSEVLGLKWDSIDFVNKRITVKHTVSRVKIDGEVKLIQKDRTKNKSSFRSLPLLPQVERLLLSIKAAQAADKKACGADYDENYLDYICVNKMGRILYPNNVSQRFAYIIKKSKLRKIRFHDLRHSCASLLLANGISLKEIQLWLGHSCFATTANIYAHLDMSSKTVSADTISKCLNIPTSTQGGDRLHERNDKEEKTSQPA